MEPTGDKSSPYATEINNNISVLASDTKHQDGRGGINNIDVLKGIIQDSMDPDYLAGITEFKGIVLKRVDNSTTNAGDDATRYLNNSQSGASVLRDKSLKPLSKYYVRIPELHGYLPLPASVSDKKRIEVHPIFTIETEEKEDTLSSLQPTDIVTVKFNDRKNFRNGVITSRYAQGILTSIKENKCPPPEYNFKTKENLAVLQSVEIKSKSTHSGDPSPSLRSRTETKKVMLIGGRSLNGYLGEVLQKQYVSFGYTLYDEDGNSTDYGVQPPRSFRITKTGTTLKQMLINPISEWTKKLIANILKVRPDIVVLQFDEIFDSDNEGGAPEAAEIIKKTIYRLVSLTPLQQVFIIGTGKSSMSGPWPTYDADIPLGPDDMTLADLSSESPNSPWIEEIKKSFDVQAESLLVSLKENITFVDPFAVSMSIQDRRRQILLWNAYFKNKTPSLIRIPKEQEMADGTQPEQLGTAKDGNKHLVPIAVYNATKEEALKHIKKLVSKITAMLGEPPTPSDIKKFTSRNFDAPEGGFTFYEMASILGWEINTPGIDGSIESIRKAFPVLWDQYINLVPKYDAITSVYIEIYKGGLEEPTTAKQNLAQKENKCLDLLKDAYKPTEDPYERSLTNRIMIDAGTRKEYPNPGWSIPIEQTERLQLHTYKGIDDLFPKNDGVSHRVILQPTQMWRFEELERGRKWADFTTDSYEWGLVLDSVDVINFKISGKGGSDYMPGKGTKNGYNRYQQERIYYEQMNSAVRAGMPIFGWGFAAPYCDKVEDPKNASKNALKKANARAYRIAVNTAKLVKKYGISAYIIDAEQCWVMGHDPIGSMIYFVKSLREMCPDLRIISQAYSSFAKFSSVYSGYNSKLLAFFKKLNSSKDAQKYINKNFKKFLHAAATSGAKGAPPKPKGEGANYTYEDFLQYMATKDGKNAANTWNLECDKLQVSNKKEIRIQQRHVLDREFLKIFDAYAPMRYSLTPGGMAVDGMALGLACQEAGGIPYIPTYTTGYWSQDNGQKNRLKATAYVNDFGTPDQWPTRANAAELWQQMRDQKGNPTETRSKYVKNFYGPGLLTMAAQNDIYGPNTATQYYMGNGYRGSLTVGSEVNPPFCYAAQAIRAGKQGYMLPNADAEGAVKKQIKFVKKGEFRKPRKMSQSEKKLLNSLEAQQDEYGHYPYLPAGEAGTLIEPGPKLKDTYEEEAYGPSVS